ncbi:unnamed protein product [Oppiella nova]|uniref:Uncharacterized protein n=1 Tax=Oppiella nova TaxID=334625 RepID=A0A7R9M390_9ACAR|nr:unnamed protein product [Oppiella nova]CAG2169743.1 unnamed protein product [Oppiella nova]
MVRDSSLEGSPNWLSPNLYSLHFLSITNKQQTLPPLETLPTDMSTMSSMNMSSIMSPFDESCMNAQNSSSDDNVVFVGAVALNQDNECQVICQIQTLQQFAITFAGIIRTRAIIVGNIFMASMPDNSTCAQTGTCMGGMCNGSADTMSTTMSSDMTSTTTVATKTTTIKRNTTTKAPKRA